MPKQPMAPASIVIVERPAVDQPWFDALQEIDRHSAVIGLSRELFTVLGPSRQVLEHYRNVYQNIPFNPDLRPTDIDVGDIKALARPLKQLANLRQAILDNETNDAVRQAYVRKIDEVLLQNDILIAAVSRDAASFQTANLAVYGAPDKKVFATTCNWLRQHAESYISSDSQLVAQAAAKVLETTPQLRGNPNHIIPRNAVFKRVRALHDRPGGYFSQLFGDGPLPENITAQKGDPVVKATIRAVGSDYELVASSDELWGIVHHRRQVVRPSGYSLPPAGFKGIIAHEVGSHLLERANGRRQPLRLLEIGLDRYECGNEGRAFVREQIVHASPYDMLQQPAWEYICLKHMAISLASGLYLKRYSFQELYEALYEALYPACLLFQTIRRPDNPVYAEATARDEIWNLLVRVLKGTDGFGGAYLKDIVYLQGNVQAWQMAAIDPAFILFGDGGKFDISRTDHRRLLASLEISPQYTSRFNLKTRFRR